MPSPSIQSLRRSSSTTSSSITSWSTRPPFASLGCCGAGASRGRRASACSCPTSLTSPPCTCTVDEDGYYFIVDRKKDLIIRGGYNVYPREIEEVLYGHPAVREAAVVGVPHSSLGEEVGAAVALKEGCEVAPEELRDYLKQRLAAYKYARVVWIVDELPKGPTGKILKREIELPEAVKAG